MGADKRKGKVVKVGKGKLPPKRKRGLADKKKMRGNEKRRDNHDASPTVPKKKLKSSWVPATQQEKKVARVIEALKSTKERQGRSKSKYEIIMVLMVVLMLYIDLHLASA